MIDLLAVSNAKTRELGLRYTFSASELEAAGRTRSATPPVNPPDATRIEVPPENKTHILEGDPYDPGDQHRKQDESGGHASGAGVPGKSEFPASWTWEDIQNAIRQVVEQGTPVDRNGNPDPDARERANQMGGTEWVWRMRGTVTINGATVELDVLVYDHGIVRTAHPTAGNPPGPPNDPNSVFVNPELPADIDEKLGDLRRTGPARYHKDTGTFTFPGLDKNGAPVTVTTDEEGNPTLDLNDPRTQTPVAAPVVQC